MHANNRYCIIPESDFASYWLIQIYPSGWDWEWTETTEIDQNQMKGFGIVITDIFFVWKKERKMNSVK